MTLAVTQNRGFLFRRSFDFAQNDRVGPLQLGAIKSTKKRRKKEGLNGPLKWSYICLVDLE